MRRQYWYVTGGTVLALGIAAWLVMHRGGSDAAQREMTPAVALATVREGEFTVVLDEGGFVGSPTAGTSQLAFANSGVLRRVYVRVGDRVSAGEALAALDLEPLALEAQGAEDDARAATASAAAAAVNRYQQRVEADRSAAAREERLYRAGVVALKDVQDARATLATDSADAQSAGALRTAAQAQAASAAAKAALAQSDLNRATLRSPSDGIVTAILHRPGEPVDPGTAVVIVGPNIQNEATLRVPSSDADQIQIGDAVDLAITGLTVRARGRVTAVVRALDPTTQTATVIVGGLPPNASAGAAVRARVTVARVAGLLVPQIAIVADPQTGDDVVFSQQRQKDGSFKFTQAIVSVRHENGTTALVGAGLKPGERIAAQGAFELLAPAGAGD